MTEKERVYREEPSLHYSLLSKLSQDPRKLVMEDDVTKYQIFGSIVDKLLYERNDFFNEFYIVNFKMPSDNIKEIIDSLFEEGYKDFSDATESIKTMAAEIGYGQSWKPETLVKKVIDQGGSYLTKLWETQDYIIITQEEYEEAVRIVEMLKYHPFTEHIFNMGKVENIEVLTQHPLYATIDNIKFKILLDTLIVDHKEKVVFPFDLKTSSSNSFPSDVYKYRYYIQGSLYTDVVAKNYPDYTIDYFSFVVARRNNVNNPLIYRSSPEDLRIGRNSGKNPNTGRWVKGYRELAKEYYWHVENDKWDDPKEVYDNKGVVELNIFGDKLQ